MILEQILVFKWCIEKKTNWKNYIVVWLIFEDFIFGGPVYFQYGTAQIPERFV